MLSGLAKTQIRQAESALMKHRVLLVTLVVFCLVLPIAHADDSSYQCTPGDSTEDRAGCLDSDGDGWSDPDEHWNESVSYTHLTLPTKA